MSITTKIRLFCLFFFNSLIFSTEAQHIVINKSQLQLYVIDKSDTIYVAPICVGKNLGQKTKAGDNKTPEGSFSISQIQNSAKWTHDFNDGKGLVIGAY